MSPWVDREHEGPGLHALVIGVSDYQFLPEQDRFPDHNRVTLGLNKVNIAATGAFRVATWLRDKYWHPTSKVKTIRLLLSPSQTELDQVPDLAEASATEPRAKTGDVEAALEAWQDTCTGHPDDIALLYISGHGIQWGDKDDGLVLLEDFSRTKNFLDQALDVGRTLKGMSGSKMPQTQLYFVDACRIHPDEYRKYEYAGSPVQLRSEFTGEDLRAAPIYYAACPQTLAKGHRDNGTYFSQALIDCLEQHALQGPIQKSTLPIARTHWHVAVSNLGIALQDRTAELASRDNERQDVVVGGRHRSAVFCARPEPPPVTVVVAVDPEDAAKGAFAELWNFNGQVQVKPRAPCCPRPLKLTQVPPGLYRLELSAGPPYKPVSISLDAQPPEWNNPITLL